MPLFAFKGIDGAGKAIAGTREADGPKGLRQTLRRDSVFLTEVREVSSGERSKSRTQTGNSLNKDVDFKAWFERVGPQDVSMFTRQLATLLKAGIPLTESLGALAEQSDNKKLQFILAGVRQRVNEGDSLANALGMHGRIFPELYINMVRSGEAAGNLDAVLVRLSDFLDAQHSLRTKVVGALTYPVIMMVVGTAVMSILMVFVIPQITEVFQDSEKALPWNTQLLIATSNLFKNLWFVMIPAGVGVFLLLRRWTRTAAGRERMDRFKLKLWLVGPLLRYLAVARFARTLATMLASGVPVLVALDIVKRVLNNAVLEKVVEQARDAIREGESVAAPLKRSGEFPSMMCHMVAVGERTGELETMLGHVAESYERDVDAKVSRMTTLLSPIMIVLMAVVVGFVVFSIIQPIMEMQEFVQ